MKRSRLPYWLGLCPSTSTPYTNIEGTKRIDPQSLLTYTVASEFEDPIYTIRPETEQPSQQKESDRDAQTRALEDLDNQSPDLLQNPTPNDIPRARQIMEATRTRIRECRRNMQRLDEQRTEAVNRVRKDLETRMSTTATQQLSITTLPAESSGHALPPGALDEDQQEARKAKRRHSSASQSSSTMSRSSSVAVSHRQQHSHDGRKTVTHAKTRGHRRCCSAPSETPSRSTVQHFKYTKAREQHEAYFERLAAINRLRLQELEGSGEHDGPAKADVATVNQIPLQELEGWMGPPVNQFMMLELLGLGAWEEIGEHPSADVTATIPFLMLDLMGWL